MSDRTEHNRGLLRYRTLSFAVGAAALIGVVWSAAADGAGAQDKPEWYPPGPRLTLAEWFPLTGDPAIDSVPVPSEATPADPAATPIEAVPMPTEASPMPAYETAPIPADDVTADAIQVGTGCTEIAAYKVRSPLDGCHAWDDYLPPALKTVVSKTASQPEPAQAVEGSWTVQFTVGHITQCSKTSKHLELTFKKNGLMSDTGSEILLNNGCYSDIGYKQADVGQILCCDGAAPAS